MLTGLLLSTVLTLSPAQAETAPAPQKLPAVEGMRPQGEIPKPAEVALPPAISSCPTCTPSVAQYPAGCATGDCYGATCNTDPLGPPFAAWSDQSFAYYWYKPAPLPALLMNNGTLLNSGAATFGQASGGRISGGRWVNDAHTLGYGYNGFLMEQRASFFSRSSDGNGAPLLTRPFTDALTGQPGRLFVSDPGRLSGSFHADSGIRVDGGELFGLLNVKYCKTKCFNLLAGFRYFDLDEYLEMFQQTSSIGQVQQPFTVAGVPTAGPVSLVDRFRTRNQFWGGEIGARADWMHKCFSFGIVSKVGLGNMHQTLDVAGQTSAPGAPTTSGGLYALSTNIGKTHYDRMGVLVDLSAEIGLQISEGSRFFVAYDFLYMNEVIRPGSQIDPVVNTRFVPSSANYGSLSGPMSPVSTAKRDDFYLYGLRFGYELQY